ncbi:MAG: SusC/RagA family TonB-linked outer membrane protein [Paludibacteraceae bacterium]|nr:SusC/RagA family TonB-linked outer membrane protein [Paludibacteraceae bacterium]
MKKIFTLLVFSLFCVSIFADMKISGIVEDAQGEPVIGASVVLTNGTVGTITDYDGAFELTVPDNAKTLTISFVGMKTEVVPVKKMMKVVLTEAVEALQGEVIAVAYGNVTKGSFVGSAQAVGAENIEKKSPTEISKALDGEIAGVQVVSTSGQPGSSASIYIRGYNSLYGGKTPLYVVDGMPFEGDLSSISPGDIASTTILKDATATALYGSRGSNGVVLITTKKGNSSEEGKIEIDVKGGANMHLLPLYDVITSPEEYALMSWRSLYNGYIINSGGFANLSASKRTDASNFANKNLFSNDGIPVQYNLWNVDGNRLVNPYEESDGKIIINPTIREGVARRAGYENLESWKDAIFRVGAKAEATLRISGGTDKTTYFTSFGWLRDEGYYINSDYQRFTVRSNITHEAKKWLKGSLNMSYSYSELNDPGQSGNMNNGFNYVNTIPAIYPVYQRDENGNFIPDPYNNGKPSYDYGDVFPEGSVGRPFGYGINPAGAVRLDRSQTLTHQVQVTPTLEFKLYKGLKFTLGGNAMYTGYRASEMTNKFYGDAAGVGRVEGTNYNYLFLTFNQLLEYTNTFGDHDVTALLGHETSFMTYNYIGAAKNYIARPNSVELSNAAQNAGAVGATNSQALESYFAQATYAYDSRYHISANYRADGSSHYAKGYRWGHFGSVGAAWSFTNEEFISEVDGLKDWLKNGKLRLSWGVTGNELSSLYSYTDLYSIENVNDRLGYVWETKGNNQITWERQQQTDLGLEVSVGKYVDVELDYYYKLIDNMLIYRYVAPSLGYAGFYTNDAKMETQGAEFTFNIHAVNTRNIKLDIRLNGGHYANKMLQMPIDYTDKDGNDVRMVMSGAMSVGHSVLDWYMPEYMGVNPETGEAQYKAYYDASKGGFSTQNEATLVDAGGNWINSVYEYQQKNPNAIIKDTIVSGDNSQYAGDNYVATAMPDLRGGFGIDFEAYGFTLSVTCSYGIGGMGYDNTYAQLMHSDDVGSRNWHIDMRNAWTENNKGSNIPRLSNGNDTYANMGSTRFLTRNDYLQLNNIRIGYNFPKKLIEKIKLNKLHIYASADNLAVLSRRRGYNPSVSYDGSSDSYQYTPLSTIMGGVKFEF